MDDSYVVDCLETSAWNISEAMQSLSKCPHGSRQPINAGTSHLCRVCMNIETKLGLISMQTRSNPDAFLSPTVEKEAVDLLRVLEVMCSWPRTSTPMAAPQQPFTKLRELVDEKHKDTLRGSIQSYLRQPFVVDGLNMMCEKLHQSLLAEDPDEEEEAIEMPEPEDSSRAHGALFLILGAYTDCVSCTQGRRSPWHPTRLFLMDLAKSDDGLVCFDVITSSTTDESWRDLCIKVSASTGRRVTFVKDGDKTDQAIDQSTPASTEPLNKFCELFQHDDGCRISLKLEDKVLMRLGVEALKHRTCHGNGLTLAQVLEQYVLTVKEKLALAHAIASAFWQFYNSQLMYRTWSSRTIWFMPEPNLRDNSERLPLRAYISFHPDAFECEFEASEIITTRPLVHRCPRIQGLAILLLEIGLGRPFQCKTFHHQTQQLNSRHSMALELLEDLKSATWENFSHTYVFTDAVEACLNFDGLTGKDSSSYDCDSHLLRRALLHQQVVSRLEWLNTSFRRANSRLNYLSLKRSAEKVDTYVPSITNEKSILATLQPNKYIKPNMRIRPADRDAFEITIICALTIEADAIEALFDHYWDDDGPSYNKAVDDPNAYTIGCIGLHNVVLAHMPSMGKGSAATVAANCRRSFPRIKLAIVVGVCGAVPFPPSNQEEIVLGDVLISDGIVQYDFGQKTTTRFTRKDTLLDSLGRPNMEIRALLAKLKGIRGQKKLQNKMAIYLEHLQSISELKANYPGTQHDWLFESSYHHVGDGMTCQESGCQGELMLRRRLTKGITQPAIHFGLIASGDTVMKSGEERDRIASRERILGFEMEGAGVWDTFPCIVIKGACDYADSHKTKRWQQYAAATAAACTKAFLSHWMPSVTKVSS